MGYSDTADLLLHIVQCWRIWVVNEENQALHMVLYCSHMMYKYYYHLECYPIKHNEEEKYIHNEVFNNIPHFIKKRLHVYYLQYGFVMDKNKVVLRK